MKGKLLACLLVLVMALGVLPAAGAAEEEQVVWAGGSELYNAEGQKVSGTNLGENDSVVKISKTIEQYQANGLDVENEFVVTLQVQTSQNIKEIASDTPDSAVLLVMDVSNSMDDCIHCGNEANQTDHSGSSTTIYYCNDTSGNTFSRRLNSYYCRYCNRLRSQHNAVPTKTSGSCAYQSRLDATKVAAKDFLSEFATNTGAQEGDRRMVAIVSYGTHAVKALDWVDITTTEGMYAAESAVDALTIANGNYSHSLQGGGTSIESGLALGRNLLGTSAVSSIDYRYTILLTDGQPTYPASDPNSNSTTSISGSTGNNNSGSSTQKSDADNVPAIAQAIRNMSKLYSICFGKADGQDVWDLKPFGDWSGNNPAWSTNRQTTVGSWLTSFSTAAYKAADASSADLFDTFSSILAQIQVAAKAWKVEDWMGDHLVYVGAESVTTSGGYVNNDVNETPDAANYTNGAPAFVWDLLTSENDPAITDWNASNGTGVLGYTYKYRVKLDNLDTHYSTQDTNQDGMGDGDEAKPSNASTAANTLATLRYATTDAQGNWPESTDQYKTAAFPVPQVKGLVGTLTFEKVDQAGNPLAGWVFRLRSNHYTANPSIADQWAYVDAVSDENGVVTFMGIPSGHSYTLLETEKPENTEHYQDAGDYTVAISWGNATASNANGELSDGNDDDDYVELLNKYVEEELGKLTLEKRFAEGSEIPSSIRFDITGPNDFNVKRELNSDDAQADGTWSWTMTGLEYGNYTVREINAVDEHGNLLRTTHDLVYSIIVDGQDKVNDKTFVSDQDEPQITVELKADDPDKTVVVQFVNNMTRKQGTLSISKSFVDLPAKMVNASMGLTMKVTATPVDENGAAISGEDPITLDLEWNGTGFAASTQLPIGCYLLTEQITGTVPGYSLLHYVFAHNDANIENGIVTIEDDKTLSVTLKNHYARDSGRIYINKSFAGDLNKEHFESRIIYVNIRENNEEGKVVAAVMLDPGDGEWTAESPLLPVGTYYLEEVVDEGEKGTAFESGYVHDVIWTPGATVSLTKDARMSIGLTNSYKKDTGYLTVSKTFEGLPDEIRDGLTVNITITDTSTSAAHTITLPKTSADSTAKVWTDTIELPVGLYTLNESVTDAEGYTLSNVKWTGLAADNTVAIAKGTPVSVSVENTYTDNYGYLTINKILNGLESQDTEFQFQILGASGYQTTAKVKVGSMGRGSTTVKLPIGQYQVAEMSTSGSTESRYKIVYTPESDDVSVGASGMVTVDVTSGAELSFTCTNTNVPRLRVKIPIQKSVKVTGNTAPGMTAFSFGAAWSSPSQLPIDVSIENVAGNTAGAVQQTAANAYTITVNGEGTVNGYLVISGFADDLDGFELTTWEKLTPYGNVQAMKDAHWNYDQTAQSDALRYTVKLRKESDVRVSYTVALGQDIKDKVAFENIYEEVDVPELPETGDHDEPFFYLLLMVLSLGAIVLLSRKYAR